LKSPDLPLASCISIDIFSPLRLAHGMKENHPSQPFWEFNSEAEIYFGLIGNDFGIDPLLNNKRSEIEEAKRLVAEEIIQAIRPEKDWSGLEIGPGCGHLIRHFAKHCRHLFGCDI